MLWVRIWIRERCTTLCDNACQWLETGRWFSPGPPVSSTNKTDRDGIAEISAKVALNTIKQTNKKQNCGYIKKKERKIYFSYILCQSYFFMYYSHLIYAVYFIFTGNTMLVLFQQFFLFYYKITNYFPVRKAKYTVHISYCCSIKFCLVRPWLKISYVQ